MTMQNAQTVGLLGLSGNPTHKGHIAALRTTIALIGLDTAELLINPHNPLKDPSVYAAYEHREHLARLEVADSADMHDILEVSDFENRLRQRGVPNETIVTLQEYKRTYQGVTPVWIMGADNLATIHTWGGDWNHIFEQYHVVVLAREGDNDAPLHSVTARAYRQSRVDPQDLLRAGAGHWTFIDTIDHNASSTDIRRDVHSGVAVPDISRESHEYILRNRLYLPK